MAAPRWAVLAHLSGHRAPSPQPPGPSTMPSAALKFRWQSQPEADSQSWPPASSCEPSEEPPSPSPRGEHCATENALAPSVPSPAPCPSPSNVHSSRPSAVPPGPIIAAATLACKPVPPLAGSDLPLPTRGLPGRFAASPTHWHGSANRAATKTTPAVSPEPPPPRAGPGPLSGVRPSESTPASQRRVVA